MASWERLAFAVLRGGVKGIPLAGGVVEEVLRVLDEERDGAGREATAVVAARAGAAPARDPSGADEAEVERLAREAWSSLPEADQRDLRRTVQALAVEQDPAERRVLARELGERLPRRLLEHAPLQKRVTGVVGPASSGGLAPGATLTGGRFTLVELLGKGGFGTVWRARHRDLGKDVALKVLNADVARDEDAQKRFLKEFEAATSFVHKYAVQLQEFGRDPERDVLYFTMALVEGPTLRDVIDREGPLEPARVVRLGAQLLEVLEEAHRAGIVHRDIKPQNLLLTTGRDGQEELRVLDFGIAKAVSSAQKNTSGLTLTGMTVGTLRYMSPEQAQGKRLDGRSDLYAAGVVLYEALSKRLPIEADPEAENLQQSLLFRLVTASPVDVARISPAPRPIAAVIMRALEKGPTDRWSDAASFRLALLGPRGNSNNRAPSETKGRVKAAQRRDGRAAEADSGAGRPVLIEQITAVTGKLGEVNLVTGIYRDVIVRAYLSMPARVPAAATEDNGAPHLAAASTERPPSVISKSDVIHIRAQARRVPYCVRFTIMCRSESFQLELAGDRGRPTCEALQRVAGQPVHVSEQSPMATFLSVGSAFAGMAGVIGVVFWVLHGRSLALLAAPAVCLFSGAIVAAFLSQRPAPIVSLSRDSRPTSSKGKKK